MTTWRSALLALMFSRSASVAFSLSEQKFCSRMSFLNAATESRAKHHRDRVPEIPPKNAVALGQASPSPGPFLADKGNGACDRRGRRLCSRLWRSGGHVAASPSACTPRKRTMNQKVGATVGNTAAPPALGERLLYRSPITSDSGDSEDSDDADSKSYLAARPP